MPGSNDDAVELETGQNLEGRLNKMTVSLRYSSRGTRDERVLPLATDRGGNNSRPGHELAQIQPGGAIQHPPSHLDSLTCPFLLTTVRLSTLSHPRNTIRRSPFDCYRPHYSDPVQPHPSRSRQLKQYPRVASNLTTHHHRPKPTSCRLRGQLLSQRAAVANPNPRSPHNRLREPK